MLNTIEQLNIDWLKSNCARLYYFGLGFIQLKINDRYRLHFYSPELPAITEDPHDHRYNFTSYVLKGEIINSLFEEIAGSSFVKRNESCNPNIVAPSETTTCALRKISDERITAGGWYDMDHEAVHMVRARDCITLLDRGDYKKQYAHVFTAPNVLPTCPFSKKVPEHELWDMIRAMLV